MVNAGVCIIYFLNMNITEKTLGTQPIRLNISAAVLFRIKV